MMCKAPGTTNPRAETFGSVRTVESVRSLGVVVVWYRDLQDEEVLVGRRSEREEAVPVSTAESFGYAQQVNEGKPRHAEVRPFVTIGYEDSGLLARLVDVVG